jgi:hypothetical protein
VNNLKKLDLMARRGDLMLVGRNGAPRLLWQWFNAGEFGESVDILRALICDVWSGAEWPLAVLCADDWREMWHEVGFVSDTSKPAPTQPLIVYRGATPDGARGWSWTTDVRKARWFAGREVLFQRDGHTYITIVDPRAVHALIDGGRGEAEVVVDPALLGPVAEYLA